MHIHARLIVAHALQKCVKIQTGIPASICKAFGGMLPGLGEEGTAPRGVELP